MKSKKLVWLLFCVLICMLFSGCSIVKPEENRDGKDVELLEDNASQEYEYPIVITPTLTDDIYSAIESEDIFCIFNGEKYGYITKSGEEITDYIYDMAYPFSEGMACVLLDGKYGFIDTEGKEAIPFMYDDAAPFSEGLAYFANEGEYGFINPDGTVVFYLDCDSVSSFSEGLAYYSIDGKYGYINQSNQFVIEAAYSDADYFKNGLAFVTIDGYMGAINTEGDVIIPIEFEKMYRTDCYVYAVKGDFTEYEYYDFEGNLLSSEYAESMYLEYIESKEVTEKFSTNEEDGIFTVIDENGEDIFTRECDYVSTNIYQNYNNVILCSFDEADSIVLIEEQTDVDLSRLILKNSITPKKELYWDLLFTDNTEVIDSDGWVSTYQEFDTWYDEEYIKTAKLYDIKNSGEVILYCIEKPLNSLSFPMSSSAIYEIYNNNIYVVARGNECGGSARGDYTCLYKNIDTGDNYAGISGMAGGFGGTSSYGKVYYYIDDLIVELTSWEWINQTVNNYDENELLEEAYLFYDVDIPYTKETIQDTMSVQEYRINDVRVSIEEFNQICGMYREITLLID